MPTEPDEERTVYQVVLNLEEQYSIWPADRDVPAGWRAEGTSGSRTECLAHVDEVWTDMRPLSLRRFMAEAERAAAEGAGGGDGVAEEPDDPAESLVSRLSGGEHPVEISLRPERTGPALREAIDRGYVYVRFTATEGGTELGLRLDRDACDLSAADFDTPSGGIHLAGDLTLDFESVRCVADIDLAGMTGHGRMVAAEPPP